MPGNRRLVPDPSTRLSLWIEEGIVERIVRVESRPGYRIWLRFTDGSEGEVDLSHLVGRGVFADWNDPARFAQVKVHPTTRTVCWPGGIDLDPDVLYARLTGRPVTAVERGPSAPAH